MGVTAWIRMGTSSIGFLWGHYFTLILFLQILPGQKESRFYYSKFPGLCSGPEVMLSPWRCRIETLHAPSHYKMTEDHREGSQRPEVVRYRRQVRYWRSWEGT
jgi:hypothetical protein